MRLDSAARVGEVGYFTMEVALDEAMPTYSGGLGVLAGDTLRAAADARVAMLGVTLLYRAGYFRQRLDAGGNRVKPGIYFCRFAAGDYVQTEEVKLAR